MQNVFPPVKTIGILGGGQLGAMLAQAALPLGLDCVFLEDAPNCPASHLGKVYTIEKFEDFKNVADVFTFEFENTCVQQASNLEASGLLFPSAHALSVAQDRLQEKHTFTRLGIATPPFMAIHGLNDLQQAAQAFGLPLVLKTTRGGYDGKGQYVIRQGNDVAQAWDALGDRTPLIAEGFVHFGREVSIIAVRSQTGDIKTYPLVENHHHEGVLSHTFAPAPDTCSIDAQAKHAITKLLEHFNYVGVLALELFVVSKDGQHHILANEIAPRVHNSGHWSIEGAVCSQFENHMRAVAGLPLGSTAVVKPSVMVNIVSSHPKTEAVLAIDGAHLHLYRKSERTGRKLGHITLLPVNSECLTDSLAQVKSILPETMGL